MVNVPTLVKDELTMPVPNVVDERTDVPPILYIPEALMSPVTSNAYAGVVVPIPTLPFCLMTNLFSPEEEAVKMSPAPLLSTTKAARAV